MAATSQSYPRYPPPPPPPRAPGKPSYAPVHSPATAHAARPPLPKVESSPPPPPPPPPRPAPPAMPVVTTPPPVTSPTGTSPNSKKRKAPSSEPGRCDLCKLSLNSDQQLQQHLQGKNHLKMLKKQETASSPSVPSPSTAPTPRIPQTPATAPAVDASGAKLDPVSQAIYDNAMGKLPKKRRVDIHCDLCDITLTSEPHADSHFNGSKHARKLKLKEQMEAMNDKKETETSGDGVDNSGLGFFCNFCDMHLNSLQQLEAHRSGEKHRKSVEKKKGAAIAFQKANPSPNKPKEIQKVQCKTCDQYFNSMGQLQQHLNSQKHQEMLKLKGLLPGGAPRPAMS